MHRPSLTGSSAGSARLWLLPWGEENAEQALKDLRKVQKEQNREFNRRMYENSRNRQPG